MVSAETLLSYSYWEINCTVHADALDKKLGPALGFKIQAAPTMTDRCMHAYHYAPHFLLKGMG